MEFRNQARPSLVVVYDALVHRRATLEKRRSLPKGMTAGGYRSTLAILDGLITEVGGLLFGGPGGGVLVGERVPADPSLTPKQSDEPSFVGGGV